MNILALPSLSDMQLSSQSSPLILHAASGEVQNFYIISSNDTST